MLPLWVRVDQAVIAMKGYPAFQKTPALLTIRLFSVKSRIHIGGVLTLYKDAVGVFFSHSRLG